MTRVLVIGGGISGMSAACHLADSLPPGSVHLLEAEPELAHHTTSRSAAILAANYGPEPIRRLTQASVGPLSEWLSPRGFLTVADSGLLPALRTYEAEIAGRGTEFHSVTTDEAIAVCPVLRPTTAAAAVLEPGPADIDVMGLFDSYARGLRAAGGQMTRSARVSRIRRDGAGWEVAAGAHTFSADVIVNAAGAWGDEVARLADVAPVGLEPRQRTALLAEVPDRDPQEFGRWPMVYAIDDTWYFKPDSGALLLSPVDETPSPPYDARPADLDIALAIERVNDATTLALRRVRAAWAGLRTFAPDGIPVYGPDPDVPNFVWAVGQGGYGIQSAPAAGALVAALALGTELPADLVAAGVDPAATGPLRLRTRS